jgi:hypothetical protein
LLCPNRMLRRALPALLLLPLAAAAGIQIQMTGGAFQVTGWNAAAEPAEGWASIFAVYAGGNDSPAMLGSYSAERGELVFHPRWPLTAGLHVRAVFHPAGLAPVEAGFDVPKAARGEATRIEHVYPSTDTLPANTLKLYIYFSAPMQRGEAWQHLRLLDEHGGPVELPFLEIDQELWDPTNTRLTVLFDPGRIKRGLLPLNESGPNIREGRRYTLSIARDWLDANGSPLAAAFNKPFVVAADEREPVDPTKWRIAAPREGTADPLVVTFPRPLDYALLQRTVKVAGVPGKVMVARGETEWRFTPDAPWIAGPHELIVQTTLEDLAGNRVGRPFDVDTFREVTRQIETPTVSVPFRIGGK